MRIRVGHPFQFQKVSLLVQTGRDRLIGVKDKLSFQPIAGFLGHAALFIDRADRWQAIALCRIEVVQTMTAGSVDTTGTIFIGNVIS